MTTICEICDLNDAKIHCCDCIKLNYYCEKCFELSHGSESKKSHKNKLIGIDYASSTCAYHFNKPKDCVCLKCNLAICPDCVSIGDHKDHKIGSFKEGLDKLLTESKPDVAIYEKSIKTANDNKKVISEIMLGKSEKLTLMKTKTRSNFQELFEILIKKRLDILNEINDKLEESLRNKELVDNVDTKFKDVLNLIRVGILQDYNCENYIKFTKDFSDLKRLRLLTDSLPSIITETEKAKNYPPISLEELVKISLGLDVPICLVGAKSKKISIKSNIIKSEEEQTLLCKWLSEACENLFDLQLLWCGSTDGFRTSNFHSKCDDKGPTVTIIRSNKETIFGGYTSQSWKSSGDFVSDPNAFIFSLTHKTKHATQKCSDYSIYCRSNYGPTFGTGNDIRVVDRCNSTDKNYCNGNQTYELPAGVNPDTYIAGTHNFKVKEIEVYSVITQ